MYIASRVGIETAIIIAAVAPLIALGMWSSRSRAWRPLFAFVALFALDDLVLVLPRMGPFAALRWNWQVIGSLLAGWARARLGSLIPLILLHNASNLVIPLATLWLSA